MSKPLEKLHLYLCTISAVIVTIACIIVGATLYWMAAAVSVTIIMFYFIGQVVRFYLSTQVFPAEEVEELEDEMEEEMEIDELEDYESSDELEDEELEPVEDAFLDS